MPAWQKAIIVFAVVGVVVMAIVLGVLYGKPQAKAEAEADAESDAADATSATTVASETAVGASVAETEADAPVLLSLEYKLQGSKLVGEVAAASQGQGRSVALSADGTTLASGGYGDDTNTGAVWIFTRNGTGDWTPQGSKLICDTPGNNQRQGFSVALSADGNTLASGAYIDTTSTGAVWIFTRNEAGEWTQQGGKLVGTPTTTFQLQGYSVALSADGNTLASGGRLDGAAVSQTGAVWVFTRDETGAWEQQGLKLVGTPTANDQFQGSAVALSADGNTLASAGYGDSSNTGAVWIFTRSGTTWSPQAKLVGEALDTSQRQGASIALSADGNTLISGGYGDTGYVGAVWVFRRNGTTWGQENKFTPPDDKVLNSGTAHFGYAVGLSGDARVMVVAARNDDADNGALWAYLDTGDGFALYGGKFRPEDADPGSEVADALALSYNGTTLAVGVEEEGPTFTGAAWVYVT